MNTRISARAPLYNDFLTPENDGKIVLYNLLYRHGIILTLKAVICSTAVTRRDLDVSHTDIISYTIQLIRIMMSKKYIVTASAT